MLFSRVLGQFSDVHPSRHPQNLALIGFMGAGKTTVGHLASGLLQFAMVDTDELIEQKAGKRISDIFAEDGEAVFRGYERDVVAGLAGLRRHVISTGGGVVLNPANVDNLRSHSLLVCLWASAECIWERVRHQHHRPLLRDPDPLGRIRRLLAEREAFYRQADVLVNTEWRSLKEVAQQVAHQFRLAQGPPQEGEKTHSK